MANSISKRAVLGVAGAALALFLTADVALVSANRGDGAPAVGLFQAMQASARAAVDGSVRFVNDMRAVYRLSHLDEIVPQARESSPWPEESEREKLFLCSESRPLKAPAKARI
ncbi:MAG: hypothetical protein ACRD5F_08200 [Candidatus Acidiferrales bacterium]